MMLGGWAGSSGERMNTSGRWVRCLQPGAFFSLIKEPKNWRVEMKLTLAEFNDRIKCGFDTWPVGAKIFLKNGNSYIVGTVNPALVTCLGNKIKEEEIAYVEYE
jgi:hypothetical protein